MAALLLDDAPFRNRQNGTLTRVMETVRSVLDPDTVELEYDFLPERQRYRCRFLGSQTSGARPVRSGPRSVAEPFTLQAPFHAPDLLEGTLTLFRRARRPWTGAEVRRFELLAPFLSLLLECAARSEIDACARRRLLAAAERCDVPAFFAGDAGTVLYDVRPKLVERGLSGREIQVVGAALQGLRNAEIATELFITEWTVKDHMKHIFQKLGVSSRACLLKALYPGPRLPKAAEAGSGRSKNPVVTPRSSC